MGSRLPPDYLILKRRAAEDERCRYEAFSKDTFKASSNAEWEIKTQGFIDHRQAKARYDSIRAADQASLDARRQKLANMLAAEHAMMQQQLEQLDESPAERKARMEARATELKDKRESERLSFVQQQYERQWRLACDPLREQESKAILQATNAARAYQIGEKMKALEMEEEETRTFDDMWEQNRLAKEGREEREAQARLQMDREHKAVLDQQVAELHNYRQEEKSLAMEESGLMRQQWELEEAEAKKIDEMRKEVLEAARDELHEFNKHKRAQLAQSIDAERAADMARLQASLAKEAADEQRETAAVQAMQAETRLFAEHMLAQKRALASREADIEQARQKEMDKAWEKRLVVWQQEQEARERLMAQTLIERRAQVEQKVVDEKIQKQREADARVKLEEELQRVNRLEAAKLSEAASVRKDHRAILENQIKEKAFKRAAGQFNKAQERASAERAELAYQAMLNDQMAKTMTSMQKFAK